MIYYAKYPNTPKRQIRHGFLNASTEKITIVGHGGFRRAVKNVFRRCVEIAAPYNSDKSVAKQLEFSKNLHNKTKNNAQNIIVG